MKEGELSEVWRQMLEQEIDVLVCTTIIETGVDLPNANTLIIENADCMGLSQLHQLRGRVGRSSRRAYAYFTFRRNKVLTEIQQKRLAAIREFTEFGSGFRVAMRDLELRGAGNIMGAQQHGHMESVGYDMYLKLLDEAVSEEKGEQNVTKTSTVLLIFRLTLIFPKAMLKVLHFVLMFTAELPISAVTRTQTMLLTSCRTDSARFRTRFSDLSTLPLCVTRLTQWAFTKSDRTAQRSCSL